MEFCKCTYFVQIFIKLYTKFFFISFHFISTFQVLYCSLRYLPYHINIHLLFHLGALVPWTTIIQHGLRLMSGIDNDAFNVVRILEI